MLYDELKYHFFKKNSYMVGILRFLLMPASITKFSLLILLEGQSPDRFRSF